MQGDMSQSQEKAILTFIAKITSITDLSTLLNAVVQEVPHVVGAIGCWIYLQPDYVPEYSGVLNREGKEISELDVTTDFIVLAATNLESKKPLIGKVYFVEGEGITGWVYKHGRPLRINNATSGQELNAIATNLYLANDYHDSDELYQPGEKRPLLVVPLILNNSPIGVLKLSATVDKQPFSEISEEISAIISQIIAGSVRQTRIVAGQNRAIIQLIETSNKNAPNDVIVEVTRSMMEMLNCVRAEFYMQSDDGSSLWLSARNGKFIAETESIQYKKGEGLVGWVHKSGLPIIISDLEKSTTDMYLTNALLEKISSGEEINDEDRHLSVDKDFDAIGGKSQSISFIAVPVKSRSQEVRGVLCAYRNISLRSRLPFARSDLLLATSFASTIALALENERQRMLGNLLIELGNLTNTNHLFEKVVNNIPKLVVSSGCSIYVVVSRQGVACLKLVHTSQNGLILEDKTIPDIEYNIGEGKTGICALYQSTLVANHYGGGANSIRRLNNEVERINSEHPNDIVSLLSDTDGNEVGIFQLRSDTKLSITSRVKVRDFAKGIVFQVTGLPSQKLDVYTGKHWSFVGVPISSEGNLMGVITLSRPTPETPFLSDDILLLTSIARRLALVLNDLRIQEERQRLVMSLAHEINTPLTGVLADSENIFQESADNPELQKIAKHNLGQVLRLHMMTSTIMSVLSEQVFTRQFAEHSIFRPLKEACELFETEAAQKGCEILGPRAKDGNFPKIEMSLFDLTIAFKNLISNAVKYSFRPPANLDVHRTIKVWGEWDKDKSNYHIFIQNYGVGITSGEIEKRLIFEPFYRGEQASTRRRTGSGFGLAYARLIIEDLHHGRIDVTSIPQGGDAYLTTFRISLPIKQP